ncbi:MAG: monofunctional biosynthetic peptidoglycan transglycosylase [Oligoflexia bacterium]|nr:monofunctional biosynthetic peptidoglycan transglycosylase [Oligoflexia bacterium]
MAMKAPFSFSGYYKKYRYFVFALLGVFLLYTVVDIALIMMDINKLSKGYIEVRVDQESGLADYEWSAKRPARWVALKAVAPLAVRAIIISEDGPFYMHPGYDLEQIKIAVGEAFSNGGRVRGASTITQQVIKNLYLTRSKSLWRKLKELPLAIYMDRVLSKNRILEIYLNIIEYGPGLYGIKPAAYHYFAKSPGELDAKEGAFLAMLLPNPKKNSSSFKKRATTVYARRVMKTILYRMATLGYIRRDEALNFASSKFSWENEK